MTGPLSPDYTETALDVNLLASPFHFQTNWYVITGASSSGKTTLIDMLAGRGFTTVPEPGRQYFEREIAKGRTIDEIRADRAACTREIYGLWLEQHSNIAVDELRLLDRGLPDSLGFFRFAGMDPNEILLDCFRYRYASVFLLDRLPYQQDGIRGGDDISAAYFDSWMESDYTALKYDVVRVPVVSPEERLAFILGRLAEKGLVSTLSDIKND